MNDRLSLADACKGTPSPSARGARTASATSITFDRDSGASTTVSSFAVSVLTVNGRNRIRRLVLNQPPPTSQPVRLIRFPKESPFMLATAESKNQAVSKLESLIERGRSRAANVIDRVMRNQPTDRLVRGDALQFRR